MSGVCAELTSCDIIELGYSQSHVFIYKFLEVIHTKMEVPKITISDGVLRKNKINIICQVFIAKYTQKH